MNKIKELIEGIEFFKTKYKNVLASKCGKLYSQKYKRLYKDNLDKDGYCRVKVFTESGDKTIKAHRLIYDTFIGIKNNENVINHKDGNRKNNAIDNLEEISILENNTHLNLSRKGKTSKYVGVHYDKKDKKWKATYSVKQKSFHLGSFNTEQDAFEARLKYFKNNNIENKYIDSIVKNK